MTAFEYERFAVRRPLRDGASGMTYLSCRQISEADHYAELGWVYDTTPSTRYASEQVLDYDQLVLHIGMDADRPQDLGATIEFYLGGRPIVFNTTTSIFIPKGTPFGPVMWKELRRPHVQLSMVFGSGDPWAASAREGFGSGRQAVDRPRDLDYEQYVIRSPLREAGPNRVEGRQNPTMTYLSRTQIPEVNNYLEFGWIWAVPNPPIPKMRHDGFDEIVLHIGSDPDNPEDLGATLQFGIGEDLLEFDTTHCAFIPKGLDHGPLIWKEVRRPMIEMALMIGAGTLDEGWENSFFDMPDGSRRGPK